MPLPQRLVRPLTVAVLATTVFVAACSQKAPAPEPVRAVRTLVMGSLGQAPALEFSAEIRARSEVALGFRVPGRLDSRAINNGDEVRAGQVLAGLDPSDLALGSVAAQAAQRAAQTNLEQLEAELKRYRDLREQGFIGPAELDRREAATKAARAQWEQARAQSDVQGRQAGYARLQAPGAGVITAVLAEPGQVLSAGTPVLRLALAGPRDAVFSVPEDKAAAVRGLLGRPGAATVRLWGSTQELPATVREVAAAADATTRTFAVKADLGAAPVRLGQTATVRLLPPSEPAGLQLPLTALVAHAGGSAVWRFDRAAGKVGLVPVSLGPVNGNVVLVTSGLKAGDEVVTAGTHVLTEGQAVRPWVAPGQAASAPASAVAR